MKAVGLVVIGLTRRDDLVVLAFRAPPPEAVYDGCLWSVSPPSLNIDNSRPVAHL